MMRWLSCIAGLFLFFLGGCLSNNSLSSFSASEENIWNISRLSIGMSETEVLHLMNYPYSKKNLDYGDICCEIWFYVTRPTGLDQSRMVRQNLTPLVFKNKVLAGWGYDYYRYILSKSEELKRKPTIQPKTDESKSLERAIEGPVRTEKRGEGNHSNENKSLEKAIEKIETNPNRKTIETSKNYKAKSK